MICYLLAMGKQHLGLHVVVGYGINIFLAGPFHYVTRSPGEYVRQRQISKKKFIKNCPRITIVHFLSNMQNVAILRYCFSVTFL